MGQYREGGCGEVCGEELICTNHKSGHSKSIRCFSSPDKANMYDLGCVAKFSTNNNSLYLLRIALAVQREVKGPLQAHA